MKKTVKFKEWNCFVKKGEYGNGRTAIQLYDAETGEPIATATVNLPDEPIAKGYTFIKDWSENEGMLESLKDYVEPTGRTVQTGFVEAKEVKIL